MTSEIAAPKRLGLAVLADIVIAPSAAFESLRARPTWIWAFVLTSVLGAIGSFLQVPAAQHASSYMIAHDPRFTTMTPEQLASAKAIGFTVQRFAWIAWPLIVLVGVFFATVFLAIGNAIGKGSASFGKIFALCANVGIIHFGLGNLLIGVLVSLRGPDAFTTTSDILSAIPNLGILTPGGPVRLHSFLTYFSVTQIWSLVLLAFGFRAVAGVRPAIAYTVPAVIAAGGALFAAATLH